MADQPRIRLEKIPHPSRGSLALVATLSVLLAFVIGGVVIWAAGENPIEVYRAMLNGAFGSKYNLSETVVKMTPLLLASLGVSVAFRLQLWNIGAEGQLYLGGIFASGVALYIGKEWNAWLLIPAMMVAGMLGGALWASIPGTLRAFLGVNETITSLMLNYVAILLTEWLVIGPWQNPEGYGFPGTAQFPRAAWLPTLGNYRLHLGIVFGLVAALILQVVLGRTTWGYQLGVMGQNVRAARYAGMPITRTILIVMAISGALAGLAGMSEVAGVGHQLQRNFSPGYGYTAIIVAWLAMLNPMAIIAVSFLLAALLVGGDQLQMAMGLPASVAPMLQGIILFCLLGGQFFTRYRVVRTGTTTDAVESAG